MQSQEKSKIPEKIGESTCR